MDNIFRNMTLQRRTIAAFVFMGAIVLIVALTEEVNHSVEDVESVNWQRTEIIEQVQAIAPRFEMVNEGMEAQSAGAGQISEVMVYLSQTSSQTEDGLRDISGGLCQLNDASQGLDQEIFRLKVSSKEAENV